MIAPRRYGAFGDESAAVLSALSAFAPTLTVQTTVTPEIPIDLTGGNGPASNMQGAGIANFLEPTIRLYAPDNQTVLATIAPMGVASGVSASVGVWAALGGLVLAAFVGIGWYLGSD